MVLVCPHVPEQNLESDFKGSPSYAVECRCTKPYRHPLASAPQYLPCPHRSVLQYLKIINKKKHLLSFIMFNYSNFQHQQHIINRKTAPNYSTLH